MPHRDPQPRPRSRHRPAVPTRAFPALDAGPRTRPRRRARPRPGRHAPDAPRPGHAPGPADTPPQTVTPLIPALRPSGSGLRAEASPSASLPPRACLRWCPCVFGPFLAERKLLGPRGAGPPPGHCAEAVTGAAAPGSQGLGEVPGGESGLWARADGVTQLARGCSRGTPYPSQHRAVREAARALGPHTGPSPLYSALLRSHGASCVHTSRSPGRRAGCHRGSCPLTLRGPPGHGEAELWQQRNVLGSKNRGRGGSGGCRSSEQGLKPLPSTLHRLKDWPLPSTSSF